MKQGIYIVDSQVYGLPRGTRVNAIAVEDMQAPTGAIYQRVWFARPVNTRKFSNLDTMSVELFELHFRKED